MANAIVILIVLALALLSAWRWHKRGMPCSCGGACHCGKVACHCGQCPQKKKSE